ncbi:glutathione S-transferase family protein [Planktomarina sp.]|nr:glutathione S-transferase family protein [Planktomarina sp.]
MELLTSAASPFARKVRVLLRETGQIKTVKEVHVTTSPYKSDPKVLAANPTGRIPALTRPEATTLYDSRVITRFLDSHIKAGLYPEKSLWDVLTIEATADAIMDSAVSISYETRTRPEGLISSDWVDAQWLKVVNGCKALQGNWLVNLNGPLNMGQISVACALAYLDLRHSARNWREGNDALAEWFSSFEGRRSMVDTHVDG